MTQDFNQPSPTYVKMNVFLVPQFLPDMILDQIFSYTNLGDVFSCMLVCKNWYEILNNEMAKTWKSLCLKKISKQVLESDILFTLNSPKAKIRALYHSWNPNDGALNMKIKEHCKFTLSFRSFTSAGRAKIGFDTGVHTWEIVWATGDIGTMDMVGISTKYSSLHDKGMPILGGTAYGWGWNLNDNTLWHRGPSRKKYPSLNALIYQQYKIGDRIHLVLDCDNSTLHFKIYKNSLYISLGLAFENLPKTILYPAVSSIYSNSNVSLVYIG